MGGKNIKKNKEIIPIKCIRAINFNGDGESYVRTVFLGWLREVVAAKSVYLIKSTYAVFCIFVAFNNKNCK